MFYLIPLFYRLEKWPDATQSETIEDGSIIENETLVTPPSIGLGLATLKAIGPN